MIGAGILLMLAQVLSKEFTNKKMVIIATINDNSSTLGAVVSSSVGFGTGNLELAGILDNSLNLAICVVFTLFSVIKVIQFAVKDLERSSSVDASTESSLEIASDRRFFSANSPHTQSTKDPIEHDQSASNAMAGNMFISSGLTSSGSSMRPSSIRSASSN